MAGKLYLCATPIGNLEDITFRVLRTLKEADLIAAEDTRNSIRLLNHFEIKTPMTSYHEYNKIEKAYQLVEKLREGKNIALITDAGTPGISDPGEDLVRICMEEGIEVTSLPGPAACITALTMSGLATRRFCFEAFLPREKKERAEIVKELEKPARDPREEMQKPILRTDVLDMKDLKPGMILKGTVRNVIDFGAFVDIGVHQDGLVHISQLSKKYIKHPLEAVSVGDIVEVKVLGVDMAKKRISLSMILDEE